MKSGCVPEGEDLVHIIRFQTSGFRALWFSISVSIFAINILVKATANKSECSLK